MSEDGDRDLAVACERMSPAAPVARPLLVHVHVPKNGGMTVTGLLDRSFPGQHLHMYLEDPRDKQDPHRVRAALHAHPGVVAVSSHSFSAFPPEIGRRAALYFALLRDPAERVLSYLRYCQKNYDTLNEQHRRQLPAGIRDMGAVEFINWQADKLKSKGGNIL